MRLSAASLHTLLKSAVAGAGDRLGFVVATGGSENFIRDHLAYECYARKRLPAARDLRRKDTHGKLHVIDLAIIKRGEIDIFIELKQLRLKDLRKEKPGHYKNVLDDIIKREPL